MTHEQFIGLFAQQWFPVYIWAFFLSVLFFAPIFWRKVNCIFDSLFYVLIFSVFNIACLIFLYFIEIIELSVLCFFLCSALLPWCLILFFLPARRGVDQVEDRNEAHPFYFYLYIILTIIDIVCYTIIYIKLGIPLFRQSRQDFLLESGFFRLFYRITPSLTLYIVLYSYHLIWRLRRNRLLAYSTLLLIAANSLLGGSKGAFTVIVFPIYFYHVWYLNRTISKKLLIKGLALGGACAILVVGMIYKGSFTDSLQRLFFRLVQAGDIYYMSLPDNMLCKIEYSSVWEHLFRPLISVATMSKGEVLPYGVMLLDVLVPGYLDSGGAIFGPNGHFDVYLYSMFGPRSIIGSCLFSFVVLKLLYCKWLSRRKSLLHLFFKSSLYLLACTGINDLPLMIMNFTNLLLALPFFLLAMFLAKMLVDFGPLRNETYHLNIQTKKDLQ